MKTTLFNIAFIAIFSLGFINLAHATVGGPTLIYDFTYNPLDESVYFVRSEQSGRGCPPMLDRISLNTEQVSGFYSCDDGEAVIDSFRKPNATDFNHYTLGLAQVKKDIADITKNFKPLTPIVLKKSNIQIDVVFKERKYYTEPSVSDFSHEVLTASVYQNGVKVDSFELTGCNKDQPFLFQGYAIPGFNKKIIILSSTKGECFEGGYIREKLHVVGGVDNLDKTDTSHQYKTASALDASESTLIVFEKDTVTVATTTVTTASTTSESVATTTEPSETNDSAVAEPTPKTPVFSIIIAVLLALGVGVLVGQRMNRKI